MHRHGPHIISIAKGLVLCLALAGFVHFGYAAEWRVFLENNCRDYPWAVYPAYWLAVMLGAFMLTFPLTLAQDHLSRVAEGQHEETPVLFWLRGLATETAIGATVGCVVSLLMFRLPTAWWLAWTALWTGYHFLASRAPELTAATNEEELPQHPDLITELNPLVQPSGLTIDRVYTLPEPEDEWSMDNDLVVNRNGNTASVYLPESWAVRWNNEELAAVILHKAWLTRKFFQHIDFIINTLTCLTCFGLFALLPFDGDALAHTTLLFAWTVATLPIFQLPALAYFRRTMIAADDAVSRQMQSPDAMIRVLERAHRDFPADANTPAWAERLFFNTPTLARRIDRMKLRHAPGTQP